MGTVTARDGTRIHYKDWGRGRPVVFSHGWPLCSDAWGAQMLFLARQGFRCIAHDRRGHGRSDHTWCGHDMDGYADDLANLMETLDLRQAMLVGHSTGGGEVVRYIARHGGGRVARLVLVAAVTPFMLRTPGNPDALPISVFDGMRDAMVGDRSQFFRDIAIPFFGANRDGSKVSEGMRDAFWLRGMRGGLKGELDCIGAFSETDFSADLSRIAVPTLVIHGDDDQIVPIDFSGRRTAQLVRGAVLKVYPGGAHGLTDTAPDQLNADLLEFARL
jgi:non-heme chloroperoxidase